MIDTIALYLVYPRLATFFGMKLPVNGAHILAGIKILLPFNLS